MILLATALFFAWPAERTEFIDRRDLKTDVSYAARGWRVVRLRGESGSMRPTINGDEFAYIEDYRGQPLQVGEIVGDRRVTHRIVALSRNGVQLCADAYKNTPDPWQPRSNIQYIVRVIVRKPK